LLDKKKTNASIQDGGSRNCAGPRLLEKTTMEETSVTQGASHLRTRHTGSAYAQAKPGPQRTLPIPYLQSSKHYEYKAVTRKEKMVDRRNSAVSFVSTNLKPNIRYMTAGTDGWCIKAREGFSCVQETVHRDQAKSRNIKL
jgi:hypothetical protein